MNILFITARLRYQLHAGKGTWAVGIGTGFLHHTPYLSNLIGAHWHGPAATQRTFQSPLSVLGSFGCSQPLDLPTSPVSKAEVTEQQSRMYPGTCLGDLPE